MSKYYVGVAVLIIIVFIVYLRENSHTFITRLIEENTKVRFVVPNSESRGNFDIVVNDPRMFDRIARHGELGFAESYMDGDWDAYHLEGVVRELMTRSDELVGALKRSSIGLLGMEAVAFVKSLAPNNTLASSKQNISHHYDVGNDLYKKMLGKHMQYTCGYFDKRGTSLDDAQYAKMELIAKKLDLRPGMTVLDIGCGFGSFARHLAKKYGVKVTGVTLSRNQKEYADANFSHPDAKILLQDYRHVKGKFDRVLSVGMFEHIGRKKCEELGIKSLVVELPASITTEELIDIICAYNNDDITHGILVQLPLPSHIDATRIINAVSIHKDVDGFHSINAGKLLRKQAEPLTPCTPEGCIELLRHYDIPIEGRHVVVIGRSNTVGLPLAVMLVHCNATVTICHSKTTGIEDAVREGDIVIAACGRGEMVKQSWLKKGAVVVDVGINRKEDSTKKRGYRLVGDVDFDDVKDHVSAITPVPGGVGPLTVAVLMRNTVTIAERLL